MRVVVNYAVTDIQTASEVGFLVDSGDHSTIGAGYAIDTVTNTEVEFFKGFIWEIRAFNGSGNAE